MARSPDLARLPNPRLVPTIEPPKLGRLSPAVRRLIKSLRLGPVPKQKRGPWRRILLVKVASSRRAS